MKQPLRPPTVANIPEEPRDGDRPFGKFLLASVPGWVIAIVAVVVLSQSGAVTLWPLLVLLAIWITTDIATFPRWRRYYESEASTRRIVGEHGVAVSELAPRGFARVRGELWQVRAVDDAAIRQGDHVRVSAIRGLELLVERVDDASPS
jgi:membrane-bound ClpP family serine protease